MHPLDGPRLKIRRAESEIEGLRRREDAFLQGSHYHVVRAEINPQCANQVLRVKTSSAPPPLEWSLDIGEIAHNLRSALNYLVCQLALLVNSPEAIARDRSIQFPIFGSEDDFRHKGGERRIKLLRPDHQIAIKRLQPYPGRSENLPLLWLEEINNADKHRLIQVVAAVRSGGPFMSYWDRLSKALERPPIPLILEDGAKIMEIPPKVHVEADISAMVAFCQGCELVRGKRVTETLSTISDRVFAIINQFVCEFPH